MRSPPLGVLLAGDLTALVLASLGLLHVYWALGTRAAQTLMLDDFEHRGKPELSSERIAAARAKSPAAF